MPARERRSERRGVDTPSAGDIIPALDAREIAEGSARGDASVIDLCSSRLAASASSDVDSHGLALNVQQDQVLLGSNCRIALLTTEGERKLTVWARRRLVSGCTHYFLRRT